MMVHLWIDLDCLLSLVSQHVVDFHLHALELVICHVLARNLGFKCGLCPHLGQPILRKSFLAFAIVQVLWQFEPGKVLWPSLNLELELEPEIRRHRYEVVEVVGCEDTSDFAVRAKCNGFNLVAALNQIAGGQESRVLQQFVEIKNNDGPSVDVQVQWHLHHETVLGADLFVQIACGDPDSMRALCHGQVDVEAEGRAREWRLHLQIEIATCQTE